MALTKVDTLYSQLFDIKEIKLRQPILCTSIVSSEVNPFLVLINQSKSFRNERITHYHL